MRSAPSAGEESAPNPELLGSLGRLVRGLSLLFWSLPISIVVCWQTAIGDWFRQLGIAPALLVTSLLFYALQLLSRFQKQERVWRVVLDRSRLLALVSVGLSPFLYWWNQIQHPFFGTMAQVMFLVGLAFLYSLNPLLWRLAAMLPDETLRLETKLFTDINRYLLVTIIVLSAAYLTVAWTAPGLRVPLPIHPRFLTALWLLTLFLFLLPVAMTMALTWKIKEAVFASIFGPEQ